MAIKPGDKVRLIDDEPRYKAEKCSRIGQEAIVLAVGAPGYESVRLKDKHGDVFYARPGCANLTSLTVNGLLKRLRKKQPKWLRKDERDYD